MFDAALVKDRLIEWISAYFRDNAPPGAKAVVGISGGKDSSVTAALCAAALGRERVLGVLMPQGEQPDIDSAYALCEALEIPYVEINIGSPVQSLYDAIRAAGLELNLAATVNTPARTRMAALYAVSAIAGGRVANTGNLSEDWVGYSTKFGDGAGDFSPLARLTVTEVKAVGQALGLAPALVGKTPLDGLSGKTDEENLGFSYAVLDRYIREGVCGDAAIRGEIDRLHAMNRHKCEPMPVFEYPPTPAENHSSY
ncbi:MAG: NAD(+) synthase [Oscillospiraceae bacterium]|nr:NAD(+) synthase [Oscillospiraceae bacterium]